MTTKLHIATANRYGGGWWYHCSTTAGTFIMVFTCRFEAPGKVDLANDFQVHYNVDDNASVTKVSTAIIKNEINPPNMQAPLFRKNDGKEFKNFAKTLLNWAESLFILFTCKCTARH